MLMLISVIIYSEIMATTGWLYSWGICSLYVFSWPGFSFDLLLHEDCPSKTADWLSWRIGTESSSMILSISSRLHLKLKFLSPLFPFVGLAFSLEDGWSYIIWRRLAPILICKLSWWQVAVASWPGCTVWSSFRMKVPSLRSPSSNLRLDSRASG